MIRALIALGILLSLATIVWIILTAQGVGPTARLRADAAADPTCQTALLAGLNKLGHDLGLPVTFTPADLATLASTGALASSYPRDAVQHTANFGLDHVAPDSCSLRMWSTQETSPGRTRFTAGNFGSVFVPACRCE